MRPGCPTLRKVCEPVSFYKHRAGPVCDIGMPWTVYNDMAIGAMLAVFVKQKQLATALDTSRYHGAALAAGADAFVATAAVATDPLPTVQQVLQAGEYAAQQADHGKDAMLPLASPRGCPWQVPWVVPKLPAFAPGRLDERPCVAGI